MSKIIIADGQTDEILDRISGQHVLNNEHERDMSAMLETFTFTAFANQRYAQYLVNENRVIIPGEDGDYREFVIKLVDKYRDKSNELIDVEAFASYQELVGAKIIYPGRTEAKSAEAHAHDILAGTEVRVGTVAHTGIRTIERDRHTDPFSALKSLATTFDLELDFRVEVLGNHITRYVDLVEQVGERRGRRVEFGKDLAGIRRIEESDEIATALLCLGPEIDQEDDEGGAGNKDKQRLEVLVEDEEARNRWGRNGQHIIAVYEPQSDNQDMTEEELRRYGRMELDKRINSVVRYEIGMVDIENVPGLENKLVRFGDTIRIKDTAFNPPLFIEARIFKQTRDIFYPENKTIELGDYDEYTVEEVTDIWQQIQEELRKKIDMQDLLEMTMPSDQIRTEISAHVRDYAEKKRHHGPTQPEDKDVIWVDTSDPGNVIWRVWNERTKEWQAGPSGPQGPRGVEGLQGPRGERGIEGAPGRDGKSSYTHIAYANSEDGTVDFSVGDSSNKAYIGMYVDDQPVDSTNPSRYKWTLIKGRDGEDGVPGPAGKDGRTPYFHTAWANSADGKVGFSTTISANKLYIGTYTDFTAADSTDPSKYNWTLIKGEQGPRGPQGPQGPIGPAGKDGVAHMGPTAPSNPAANSTWFQTDSSGKVIAIKKWNGSTWTIAKMNADVLGVSELSAITANLGDVTAGSVTGVDFQTTGPNGTVRIRDDVVEQILGNPNGSHQRAVLTSGGLLVEDIYREGSTYTVVSQIKANDGVLSVLDNAGNVTQVEPEKIEMSKRNGGHVGSIDFTNDGFSMTKPLEVQGNISTTGVVTHKAYGFLSLVNGWENYGGSFALARYVKQSDDMAYLMGVIRRGTIGTTIATLPVGVRPLETEIFAVGESPTGYGRIYIYADGRIVVNQGGSGFISLSGISFKVGN